MNGILWHLWGGRRPNAFGLYDVLGNVEEWVEDCWNVSYEGAPMDGSAGYRDDCPDRVVRGGSYAYPWGRPAVRVARLEFPRKPGAREWVPFGPDHELNSYRWTFPCLRMAVLDGDSPTERLLATGAADPAAADAYDATAGGQVVTVLVQANLTLLT